MEDRATRVDCLDFRPFADIAGACCAADGSCSFTTGDDCTAMMGTYMGDNVPCEPNPCPQPPAPGACCFADGSCLIQLESECFTAQGVFQGETTACEPNPCPQPPAVLETSWGKVRFLYR